jgi:hypothetical protein
MYDVPYRLVIHGTSESDLYTKLQAILKIDSRHPDGWGAPATIWIESSTNTMKAYDLNGSSVISTGRVVNGGGNNWGSLVKCLFDLAIPTSITALKIALTPSATNGTSIVVFYRGIEVDDDDYENYVLPTTVAGYNAVVLLSSGSGTSNAWATATDDVEATFSIDEAFAEFTSISGWDRKSFVIRLSQGTGSGDRQFDAVNLEYSIDATDYPIHLEATQATTPFIGNGEFTVEVDLLARWDNS